MDLIIFDIPLRLLFFYTSAFCMSALLTFCIFLIAISKTFPDIYRSKREKIFYDYIKGKYYPFPSLDDEPTVNLSVIVPAYNEKDRLPPMLEECIEFLEERAKNPDFKYEIIVVSDGSKDKTVQVASKYSKKVGSDKLRILELRTNRGKGGAVRLGMLSARGALLLFADADGATRFSDFTKLEQSITAAIKTDYLANPGVAASKLAISIGSRAHLEQEAIATRNIFRTFLMHGFHFLVWFFAVKGIKDTQCGFKLLTREAARVCFESLHVERWAFDVELLYIAQQMKIPISEIPVHWTEIEGSKITPVISWLQMGMDLALIWLRYLIGAWKIRHMKKE